MGKKADAQKAQNQRLVRKVKKNEKKMFTLKPNLLGFLSSATTN